MIFILIIILFLLLFLIYAFNGKKVYSVSFISTIAFIFSSFEYALFIDYYGSDISIKTVLVIIGSLLFIFGGEIFAQSILIKTKEKYINQSYNVISLNGYVILLATIFTIACGVYYFIDVYKFSLLVGNTPGNFFSMTQYVRLAKNYGSGTLLYSSSPLLNQLCIVNECLFYLFLYIFLYNLIFFKKRKITTLLPCIGYLFYILACASRSNVIKNFAVICIIFFSILLFKPKTTNRKMNRKILLFGTMTTILFLVVFRILGYRTGVSYNSTFTRNIAKYTSSGIFGLDYYLRGNISFSNTYFGQNTFRLIYLKMNDWGAHFSMGDPNDPFFKYYADSSNIYTGLKSLIVDFTFIGLCVFLFVWSLLLNILMRKNKESNLSFARTVFIGLLFFPIVMISVGPEWGNTISMTTIYTMFYSVVIDRIIFSQKKNTGGIMTYGKI